jgi:hypothetical protein
VLYKFKHPITIQELREHPHLQNWKPLRAGFRSRAPAFRISPEDWEKLNLLASHKNPGYGTFLKDVEGTTVVKSIECEEELRKKLVQNLGVLKRFGYDLELYVDPNTGRNGREFVCKGHGGRIDLLCYDKQQRRFVVIELKNVKAGQNTFGQVSAYVGWVQDNLAGKKPIGLVISRGYDAKFEAALKITDRVRH